MSGGVAQILNATRKPQLAFSFTNGSLAESANGTLLNSGITGHTRRIMPKDGSIYLLAASYSEDLTAGTLQFQPIINGTVQAFHVAGEAAGASGIYGSQPARITTFKAGDAVGVVYNAAALNPAGIAVQVELYVLLEQVEL